MFQVVGRDLHPRIKYDRHVYTVYAVKSETMMFLVWYGGRWVWEKAELFEPVEEMGGSRR